MSLTLRSVKSIPTLMHWRAEVLSAVFGIEPSARMLVQNRRYYRKHIPDGSHIMYVVNLDGEDCGCGAVCFEDELPSPDNPSGLCAYLMNIYVRPHFRGQGIGHTLVNKLIEEAQERDCGKIYLETTDSGRILYEQLGFRNMKNMMELK